MEATSSKRSSATGEGSESAALNSADDPGSAAAGDAGVKPGIDELPQTSSDELLRLATVLDALPAGTALVDTKGVVVVVNRAWREFANASALVDFRIGVGQSCLEFCGAAEGERASLRAKAAAGIRSVLSRTTTQFSLEYPGHSPSKQFWFLMSVTPLAGAPPQGAVVMHVDITERKRNELDLLEGKQRFDGIVTSAMDAIVSVDEKGRIVLANPAAESMFGYAASELQGQRLDLLIPSRFRANHSAHIAAFGLAGVTSRRMGALRPVSGLRKNGEEFLIEASISTHRSATGASFTAILRDIADRERAEVDLATAHADLVKASREAGMAEVASSVLHNVGNVLNSVNVSAHLAIDSVKGSKVSSLARVVALLGEHQADLGAFFDRDPKGRQLPAFLAQLARRLEEEQATTLRELESLRDHVDHIKQIVSTQQSVAKVSGQKELLEVRDLVEGSLLMVADALKRHAVDVVREFSEVPRVEVDKHKAMQILVNLMRNAKFACLESGREFKCMTLRITATDGLTHVAVTDNGVGIAQENLTRIFSHGFTTRKDGHGFGLHSGALAAREMGGSLTAHSPGPGRGATFIFTLPQLPLDSSDRETRR